MRAPARKNGTPLFYAIALQLSENDVKLVGKMQIIYTRREAEDLAKELRQLSGKPFVAVGCNIVPKSPKTPD